MSNERTYQDSNLAIFVIPPDDSDGSLVAAHGPAMLTASGGSVLLSDEEALALADFLYEHHGNSRRAAQHGAVDVAVEELMQAATDARINSGNRDDALAAGYEAAAIALRQAFGR